MKKNVLNLYFIIIVILFVIYNSILIYNTSFIINGQRYFSLADDQMISMKYAKNFADGNGLVWEKNEERTEGYSNFMWVMLMTLFHFMPISINTISLLIQITGMVMLLLNLIIIKKITEFISKNNPFIMISSVILSAFYFPLNYWSIHGFEISAIVLILNISVYIYLKNYGNIKKTYIPFVLLSFGILLRLDMVIPYLVFFFFLIFSTKERNLKNITLYLLPLFIVLSGSTIFRILYYGEVLPNTYYLKMSNYPALLRISRGIFSFFFFIKKTNFILFFIPFVSFLFIKKNYIRLFISLILGQILYSIYVGGDTWEWWGICNRFIVIIMPLFFILYSISLYYIYSSIKTKFPSLANWKLLTKTILIIVTLISFVKFNTPYGLAKAKDWLLVEPPFEVWGIRSKIQLGLSINKISNKNAIVAEVAAGVIPYFFDHKYIDLLGKNDKFIAKGKMRQFEKNKDLFKYNNVLNSKYTFFYPGHLKWDYSYSLGKFKPDIIVDLWGNKREAIPFLKGYSTIYVNKIRLIVKNNSKNIYWDKISRNIQK